MSDVKDAEEVAGKLLGHAQCYRCRKYVPKDETRTSDPKGLYIMPLCDKCMSSPEITIGGGVGI